MEFVLRTRSKMTNEEKNVHLGNRYSFVHKKWSPEAFEKHLGDGYRDDIYAFVVGEDEITHVLYDKQWCYIMTGKGQTFANVTYEPIKQ